MAEMKQDETKDITEKETMKNAPATEEKKKSTSAKKAGTRKTVKKNEVKETVYIQYLGKEICAQDLMEQAKSAYLAAGHQTEAIKTMDVYFKPEENVAYYAVNGEGSDEDKILL